MFLINGKVANKNYTEFTYAFSVFPFINDYFSSCRPFTTLEASQAGLQAFRCTIHNHQQMRKT